MGDLLQFKRKALSEKHKGKTLCANGHHAWITVKESLFDVKKGALVTTYECKRCKKIKNKLI